MNGGVSRPLGSSAQVPCPPVTQCDTGARKPTWEIPFLVPMEGRNPRPPRGAVLHDLVQDALMSQDWVTSQVLLPNPSHQGSPQAQPLVQVPGSGTSKPKPRKFTGQGTAFSWLGSR